MRNKRQIGTGLMVLAVALAVAPCQAGEVEVAYAYNLSDFTGTIPVSHAAMAIDRDLGETYMVYQNVVRIFNSAGMQTFSFGDPDPGLLILSVAVGDGDIFALVRNFRPGEADAQYLIQHRNYRGELLATRRITGLPPDRPQLDPTKICFRDGHLLLVDKARLLVVETDLTGAAEKVHDIARILAIVPSDNNPSHIFGFGLAPDGSMLLTIPTSFRAFVIKPDGAVRSFGKGGSIPGTFGVAAGITADDRGRTYVSDRLRSVVMIFDADLNFITEFGYRGRKPENLISPNEMVIDKSRKLYVTQRRDRGVAVFTVTGTDQTDRKPDRTQDRKEVSADTYSGSITSRSDTTPTEKVGPESKPISDRFRPLDRRAISGRPHEEKP